MDIDNDDLQKKTVHSVKSRIIKKCPGASEQQLHREIKKLQKDKDSFQQRLKKARKLSTNSAFQNALKKFKTLAAIFTVMQFREINKPKMGRRFTKEEKIMALSMYKRGPRAYRWLSKIFILPSSVTLSRLLSKAGLKPGFNENIFNQLYEKLKGMKEHEKLCTLIFDEMAITPHFDYNRRKDRITGFVNYEGESVRKIADHVLVFMIRGIVTNYKQPIFYSFSAGSTRKEVLARLIKQIIQELNRIGFTVMATVCDQGTSNVSATNYLIEDTRQKYLRNNTILKHSIFEVEGKTVIPLYDLPHLLKGLRNNLITKNLKYSMDGQEKVA
ncbi:hypothetical protein HF086_007661 [Spodoptera exigua]|uniref:Transposable element P transposase-like RNase H domain-containing protein n=1 Tax=Spodoptera exigua TaxID=7107 RepID=A0A922M7H4_SPOEX|nr:hypothetical protein HF086_007661 [Spodoptera exigua]